MVTCFHAVANINIVTPNNRYPELVSGSPDVLKIKRVQKLNHTLLKEPFQTMIVILNLFQDLLFAYIMQLPKLNPDTT
jgi:hypothetical protein